MKEFITFNNGWITSDMDILFLMSRLASKICHHTLSSHFNAQIQQTCIEYRSNYFVCMMLLQIFIKTPEKYLQKLCAYAFFKFSWVKMMYFSPTVDYIACFESFIMPFIDFSNRNCVSAYTLRRKNYFYDRF